MPTHVNVIEAIEVEMTSLHPMHLIHLLLCGKIWFLGITRQFFLVFFPRYVRLMTVVDANGGFLTGDRMGLFMANLQHLHYFLRIKHENCIVFAI